MNNYNKHDIMMKPIMIMITITPIRRIITVTSYRD